MKLQPYFNLTRESRHLEETEVGISPLQVNCVSGYYSVFSSDNKGEVPICNNKAHTTYHSNSVSNTSLN